MLYAMLLHIGFQPHDRYAGFLLLYGSDNILVHIILFPYSYRL